MYNCKLNSRVYIIIKEDIKIQLTSPYCLETQILYDMYNKSTDSLPKSNNFASINATFKHLLHSAGLL